MLTERDLNQLKQKGISQRQVEEQISFFQKGFPYLNLNRAACVGDGIVHMSEEEVDGNVSFYENNLEGNEIVKFVPASGAASRMFKEFFGLMQDPQHPDEYSKAVEALKQIQNFSFFQELQALMSADNLDLEQQIEQEKYSIVLEYILTERGLNYGFLPKGLLKFHQYNSQARVPMEEHLVEAAHYGTGTDGVARLHFTVSPQHRELFDQLENQKKPVYQQEFKVTYDITYSEQKPSTDTIAVELDNSPFRNDDQTLLFRPGGHGALLENLNEIKGDIIFIKNIDNVVPDHLKAETYRFKKAIAGLLIKVREDIFQLLRNLDLDEVSAVAAGAKYLEQQLSVYPSADQEANKDYVHSKLNRPLRVCGMVRNLGEPGGGPFWAVSADGTTTLQIVETSQVDPDSLSQQEIVSNATHFNPVDLVCSTRNYLGKKFNLLEYRDPNTGFISQKSKDGRELKALELPGLWNGSMANWSTIFVEVPAITFNPVKTVNDLLRKEHQPL